MPQVNLDPALIQGLIGALQRAAGGTAFQRQATSSTIGTTGTSQQRQTQAEQTAQIRLMKAQQQSLRGVQRGLDELQNVLKDASGSFSDIEGVLRQVENSAEQAAQEIIGSAQNFETLNRFLPGGLNAFINLRNGVQDATTAMHAAEASAKAQEEELRSINEKMAMLQESMTDASLSMEDVAEISRDYYKLETMRTVATQLHTEAQQEAIQAQTQYRQRLTQLVQATDAAKRTQEAYNRSFRGWLDQTKQGMQEWTNQNISFKAGLALIIVGLKKAYDDLQEMGKYGGAVEGGAVGGFFKQYFDAIRLGMSHQEMTQLMAENRQAIMAAGGISKGFQTINNVQDKYFEFTGNLAEAAKLAGSSMTIMARSGIRPTQEALMDYANELEYIQKATGMTGQQFNAHIQDMLEDEDFRYKLQMTTNEQERKAQLDGIKRQLAANVALGMTPEAAKAAQKALNALAGETPKERFKKAAKLQAMGGMLGMGSEAAEAARIMRLGARATPEEQARQREILTAMANKATAAGMGSYGQEFAVRGTMEKLGLEPLLGKGSPFITTLTDTLKPNTKAMEDLNSTNKGLTGEIMKLWQTMQSATGSAGGVIMGGIAGLGVSALLNRYGGKALGGLFGRGAAAAAGGAAPAAGGAAARGGLMAAGRAGLAAAGSAAAVAGAGWAGWEIGQFLNENTPIQDWLAQTIDKVTGLDAKVEEAMKPVEAKGKTTTEAKEAAKVEQQATVDAKDAAKMTADNTKGMLEKMDEHIKLTEKLLITSSMTEEGKKDLMKYVRMGNLKFESLPFQYVK